MSHLVAVAYPDRETAERVMGTLGQLQKEHVIQLEDAVMVVHEPGGKVKLHQGASIAGLSAAGGALWGGLIGLLFFAPLLGMALGAAGGALAGKLTDVGVDDKFMRDLGAKLPPGGAAVILLVRQVTPDKVLPRIAEYGGEVLQTSLSDEAEARLEEALRRRATT